MWISGKLPGYRFLFAASCPTSCGRCVQPRDEEFAAELITTQPSMDSPVVDSVLDAAVAAGNVGIVQASIDHMSKSLSLCQVMVICFHVSGRLVGGLLAIAQKLTVTGNGFGGRLDRNKEQKAFSYMMNRARRGKTSGFVNS